MIRSAGIILPVFSLPSPYGIGSLGKAAYEFIDFLYAAKQSWWQILPVGPTSFGDSPYQSFSTYAGNPYFIDLELLAEDGLLNVSDIRNIDWGSDARRVDYKKIYNNRFSVLYKAYTSDEDINSGEYKAFIEENSRWLNNYALFMAVKKHFGMKAWYEWDDIDIRLHRPEAVRRYTELLSDDIAFFKYTQFLFYKQWRMLHEYAASKNIGIIGDLPIYVAFDSADVWAEPEYFMLNDDNMPTAVAGVPPDYFAKDGQLWGNPLYDYDTMRRDGYGWWIRRVDGALKLYDMLRIDHFRGFESFWAVPYGDKTAKNGKWLKGPGSDLIGRLTSWFSGASFIAEDLGILTDDVKKFLLESSLPGMKVLEFAFAPEGDSEYLPHRHKPKCVCYTGTHDNAPLKEWLQTASDAELGFAEKYLGLNGSEGYCRGILRAGMSSVAELFIAQMQDYLELGAESRTNTPGTLGGNWGFRLLPNEISPELAADIAEMTVRYGRSTKDENKTTTG